MDEVRLNHMPLIGPGMWNLLHAFAIEATNETNKDHFEYFVKILNSRVKCDNCSKDFEFFLKTHPLHLYRNIRTEKGIEIGYYQWSCEFHNYVNKKLGKLEVPMEKSYKFFLNSTNPCVSCTALQ